MIILDGMPGAGKSTMLNQLQRLAPMSTRIFPEAEPCDCQCDNLVAEHLLQQACERIRAARQLEQSMPGLLTASDRAHIGVLAYRFALMRTGRGTTAEFEYALRRCHELGLMAPQSDVQLIVLLVEPAESIRRREAYAQDPRHRIWFDTPFLVAYHQFLLSRAWVTSSSQPQPMRADEAFGWGDLIKVLPPAVADQVVARVGARSQGQT